MHDRSSSLLRGLRTDQSAQVLPVMAFMLVALLVCTGFVVDLGHAFVCYRELQAATDAAALAGAQSLPNTSAVTAAKAFSALTGSKNATSNLPPVSMASGYPMLKCLKTLAAQGMSCAAPASANAVVVRQELEVPMFFVRLLGKDSLTVTATSTAAMRGASNTPANIAIILDSTPSMGYIDSDSSCNNYRLLCATEGIQTLLSALSPCGASQAACGRVTNSNVANPVDKVAIFTFPGVTADTAQNAYNCSNQPPTVQPYSYPNLPTYQITPFSSDYRASSTSSTLSSTSNVVAAVWGNYASKNCFGIYPVTRPTYYTYFAGVIYAAQAALQAAHVSGTKDVIVFLSDGDANAPASSLPGASTTSYTYPSIKNQCAQAVTAARSATAAGTTFYSVSYGSTSAGCSTDTSGITPCQTMQQMASSPHKFYSDYTSKQGDGTCISAAQPTSDLKQIFQQIAGDLTVSRLIPDNTP